jgi:transposase
VVEIDKIKDPEKLRRIADLLDREVDRLQEQVKDLAFENARLRGESLAQVDFSFPALAKALAESDDIPADKPRGKRRPQRGHGPHPQERLPKIEQVSELPEQERDCKACGGHLDVMTGQFEESEEITVTERSYALLVHRRQKYRCRCNGNVTTAPGPLKLIPGGRYSLDFASHVAVQKYGDHLPLERQVGIMDRHGLEVTSQALWDQLEAGVDLLQPTYDALGRWLLTQPLVHVDESGWPVNSAETKKPCWTAWCLCNPQALWLRIASSKSEAEGRRLLGEYRGTVVADGYKVYKNLADNGKRPGYRLAHCWAHVLRKFRDTTQTDPRSHWILEHISALYTLEKEIRLEAGTDAERHLALRKERAGPLLEKIRQWALAQGGLRRSEFGKAVAYLLSHWSGLKLFLDDAAVPLDNNPAERALRGLVLGRKNHYGSRSQRGADVSAIFYSLIGTAKMCRLEPATYLRQAYQAALRQPGAITLPF